MVISPSLFIFRSLIFCLLFVIFISFLVIVSCSRVLRPASCFGHCLLVIGYFQYLVSWLLYLLSTQFEYIQYIYYIYFTHSCPPSLSPLSPLSSRTIVMPSALFASSFILFANCLLVFVCNLYLGYCFLVPRPASCVLRLASPAFRCHPGAPAGAKDLRVGQGRSLNYPQPD